MSPRVSIVVPVYNKEEWIEETLSTIAIQAYTDWECLLVDDGSTDRSVQIIRDFIDRNPGNWQLISQVNQGQSVARNNAISRASGEFIALLDGDDLWSRNKLQVQVDLMDKNVNASVVICPYLIYDAKLSSSGQRIVEHKNTSRMMRRWLNFRGFGGGTESTGLIRATYLKQVGGFDPRLSTSAGADLTLRLSRVGRILNAPNTMMKYRIHTGQWHTNLDVLSSDLNLLYEKITWLSPREMKKLRLGGSAYLTLQHLRQDFSFERVLALIKQPALLLHLLLLLAFVIRRNFVSRLRAMAPAFFTIIPPEDL